ncbi:uncharacterized protein LOC117340953 isoform X1 [Pecten maximus]|uniref:uncharacterized protein LOC117340953 isoform X1 n=1 Tax=Pecten maximus TaxID=6579 RepID=UPI001458D7F1|nr:uncharacterized protein LOC117340953 isoform X1 [Pecten maximus]
MNAMFLSNPEPVFSWSFETSPGTGVTNLVNGRDNFDIQNMFTVRNMSAVSVGTRKNIQASWFGVYNVTATNSQGSDTLSFTAAAKGKPDPPYGGLAMCPFEDRATLSWTSGFNGGSSQTFIVGIRTDTQNSITIDRNISQSDPGRGQSVTTTVTGLAADTKHFFTVYAVNEFGNSSLIQEVNCTTKARPSLAESTNVAAVVLPVTGVLILLLTAGVVIFVRRNRQLCCRNCQLPKQTELQNVQLSERDLHINNLIQMTLLSRPYILNLEGFSTFTKTIQSVMERADSTCLWRDAPIRTSMMNFTVQHPAIKEHMSIPSLAETGNIDTDEKTCTEDIQHVIWHTELYVN